MENIMSETEDIVWLAYKLKDVLDDKISINQFGLYGNQILEVKYAKDGEYCRRFSYDEIRAYIKYNKDHFLRIQIEDTSYSFGEKARALQGLTQAIATIKKDNGEQIGLPLAIYVASNGDNDKTLTVDWAFSNVDEWLTSLKEDTMFDDGATIEHLQLINNPTNATNNPMRVFVGCSASDSIPDEYFDDCAVFLAKLMKNKDLVFGAYNAGLMRLSHLTTSDMGGKTIGIAPEVYASDLEALNLPKEDQILTKTIGERTAKLIEKSDALVFLPGGIGTIYELFAALESKRNHEFDKPIVIYNSNGFFDGLIEFMEKIYGENFASRKDAKNYLVSDSFEEIRDYIDNYAQIRDTKNLLDSSFQQFSERLNPKGPKKELIPDDN